MTRSTKKWLALLLSLLLGLAPLQGVGAGLALGGGSGMTMTEQSMDPMAAMAGLSMDDCADCATQAVCAQYGCAMSHPCAFGGCAVPAMVPSPAAAHTRIESRHLSPALRVAEPPAPPLTALFRPPIR